MRQQSAENRITELLAQLVTEVRGSTALGLTDKNKYCEDCLVPVLRHALDLPRLRNLNRTDKKNFPAIDLADDETETAIQVTATPDRGKVMDTLRTFVAHGLHTRYRRLLVYVLTERKERYSSTGLQEIHGEQFDFDINRDVLDYRNVLRQLQGKSLETLGIVVRALERQLARVSDWSLDTWTQARPQEVGYLNLLGVDFPSTLYVADIVFSDSKERPRHRSRTRFNLRKRVQTLMEQRGVRFSADWTCHNNRIMTFHDLTDASVPLSKIVDHGTVTELTPDEYYGEDADQERVFKSLLHNCLKQALFKRGIRWQHEAALFIFAPTEEEQMERQESWGPSGARRGVYWKTMNKKDPAKVLIHKHLAFARQFVCYDDEWFVVIKPEWFFSFDGYRKSRYGDKSVTWLKKHEWNSHVFTHLRFLVDFLTAAPQRGLFDDRPTVPYPYLRFSGLASLADVVGVPDTRWLNAEAAERRKKIESGQAEFDF